MRNRPLCLIMAGLIVISTSAGCVKKAKARAQMKEREQANATATAVAEILRPEISAVVSAETSEFSNRLDQVVARVEALEKAPGAGKPKLGLQAGKDLVGAPGEETSENLTSRELAILRAFNAKVPLFEDNLDAEFEVEAAVLEAEVKNAEAASAAAWKAAREAEEAAGKIDEEMRKVAQKAAMKERWRQKLGIKPPLPKVAAPDQNGPIKQ